MLGVDSGSNRPLAQQVRTVASLQLSEYHLASILIIRGKFDQSSHVEMAQSVEIMEGRLLCLDPRLSTPYLSRVSAVEL
jgi:hypothetical protein